MSWTSVHVDRDDDIRPATSQIPGYVQIHIGGIGLIMRVEKAQELLAVLGEAIAAAARENGGGSDA